jgi:hypothetical protein
MILSGEGRVAITAGTFGVGSGRGRFGVDGLLLGDVGEDMRVCPVRFQEEQRKLWR